jgi:hypothetical protein
MRPALVVGELGEHRGLSAAAAHGAVCRIKQFKDCLEQYIPLIDKLKPNMALFR